MESTELGVLIVFAAIAVAALLILVLRSRKRKAEAERKARTVKANRVRVPSRAQALAPGKKERPKPPAVRGPFGPAAVIIGVRNEAVFSPLFTCQPMRLSLLARVPIEGKTPDFRIPYAWQVARGSGIGERPQDCGKGLVELSFPPEVPGQKMPGPDSSLAAALWDRNGRELLSSALAPEEGKGILGALPFVKKLLFTDRLLPALKRVCVEEAQRFSEIVGKTPGIDPKWKEKAEAFLSLAREGRAPDPDDVRSQLPADDEALPPKLRLSFLRVAAPFLIASGVPWEEAVSVLSRMVEAWDAAGGKTTGMKPLGTFLTRVAAFNGHLPRFAAEVDSDGRVTQFYALEETDVTGFPRPIEYQSKKAGSVERNPA